MNRRVTGICLCIVLVSHAIVAAQTIVHPPGFSPGQIDDSIPDPPTEPQVFSGSGDASEVFDGSSAASYPNRNRILPRGRGRYGRLPATISPVIDDETEPGLPLVWFRAEALLWWSKASPVPVPIVTVGNPADEVPGALGQPGTSVLLGNQNLNLPGRGGGRYTFGFSIDPDQTWGLEGTYFSLSNATVSQGVFSNGGTNSAWLAFPFYNPNIPAEDSSPIALPSEFSGQAILSLQSALQGTDVNLLHNLINTGDVRVDLLGGFRYVNFQENLLFTTDSPNVDPNPPGFFHTFDQFNATNHFYGGQLGVRASYDRSRFFMNATSKLAMGSMFENVGVNGGTFTNIGGYASAPGAYLSQPTSIGSSTRNQFAVVPELNLNVGFRLRPWASVIVGYSFLYLSSVARPGDQIDNVVNPSQASAISNQFPANLSGTARPDLTVHNTDFWAQGLNFALELRF